MIVKKTGEFYIVEIKSERDRNNETVKAKKKAVKRLEKLQSNDRFKYHIIYTTDTDFLRENLDEIDKVLAWIRNDEMGTTLS